MEPILRIREEILQTNTEQIGIFDNWQKYCTEDKDYYLNWGSGAMNDALKGTSPGTSIFIGAQPNFGKSQLMTSMMIGLLKNNSDVTILDFTLDDPINKRITQYISGIGNLEMNAVDYSTKITKPEDIQRFKDSCELFRHWMSDGSMYMYESSSKGGDNQAQIGFISKTVQEVRKQIGDRKLVIVIDAINDVDNSKVKIEDSYARSESVSKELNKILIQNDAILFASSHIRKNGGKRPTLEDMKGNSYLAYSAKVVIGIHNDMKLMRDKSKIFWKKKLSTGEIIKMPVLEAHFLKSKVSAYSGTLPYLHEPAKGLVREPDKQTLELLQSMIYAEI